MKIAFVLPKPPKKINGGYRIVYQYATLLCERGHKVTLYYSCNSGHNERHVPVLVWYMLKKLLFKKYRWFDLDKRIEEKVVFDIADKYIDEFDAIFATAIDTSKKVSQLSSEKGVKFYLIQDIESWGFSIEDVIKTYNYDFTNITISKFLYDFVVENSTNDTEYIRNGLDISGGEWGIDIPIDQRNDYSISFLYHKAVNKGCNYTIEVIKRLKEKYPSLKVVSFGNCERPNELPDWIEYIEKADRKQVRKIYNESAIFICSTISEGFGLTGAESMACGCAFVSTNYDAVFDYAVDQVNALLSPVKDVDAMEKNVVRLIEDPDLRKRIAYNGSVDIQALDWKNSIDKLEKILFKKCRIEN